jgi:hypothetical protein
MIARVELISHEAACCVRGDDEAEEAVDQLHLSVAAQWYKQQRSEQPEARR